jgi:oxygen-independent coproporphyrinogen-3 oxidase
LIRALYVHVPFCRSRCDYCAFASEATAATDPLIDRYLAALERELEARGDGLGEARPGGGGQPAYALDTAYIGGGTPTWLGVERLARLVRWARSVAGEGLKELTVEANPDSLDAPMAEALAASGVTRISIGIQSFDDAVLVALGRAHDAAGARAAVTAARAAGVASVSLDLIAGCPEESDAGWRHTVEEATELGVDHVSVYALSVEEGTPLARAVAAGRVDLPDDDAVADRLRWADDGLERAGLIRYEVSNWARPGCECAHNLHYWRYDEYLGLGAGAVSGIASMRTKGPVGGAAYVRAVGGGDLTAWEDEHLDPCTMARERVMLGLRLTDGIPVEEIDALERACGRDTRASLDRWREGGFLAIESGRIRLTSDGMMVSSAILSEIVG